MRIKFEQEINNSKKGILIEKNNSEFLLVSFGGINQGLGIPVFEFFNSLKLLGFDKIFLRDFNQMWYQKGVDSNINDLLLLKEFIKHEINLKSYKKIVFLGNSMGGYAAILFGIMINVDEVISFAPQTFIDKTNRLKHLDFRWFKQIKKIHSSKNKHHIFFNLKHFLNNNSNYKTNINIYFSNKHRLDRLHAKHIKNLKNVSLNSYEVGGHSVIKTLRDSGELQTILTNLFK